jgi:DNA (cytosine-5)-methyltransferase 1
MYELALFAGAGGGILGGMLHGWRTVCAVEIEDYPRRVLLQRQADGILPRFPIWDDVCTFDGKPWRGKVDVISGGFPCQDISAAGKGAGIEGSRSGLWKEMARIIGEVRPRYVFVENSPLLISRGLTTVLSDLAQMGYDSQWGIISASDCGAPHKRDRVWVVATNAKWDKQSREKPRFWPIRRMGGQFESVPWYQRWQTALCTLRGVDVGDANQLDRTDAIRNGQVPIVAATAWEILTQED